MNQILLLSLGAIIGVLAHFSKKYARQEITGNLYHYFVVDYPGNTISALLTLVSVLAAIVATGQLEHMQTAAIVAMGFGSGWVIDSGVNKGA